MVGQWRDQACSPPLSNLLDRDAASPDASTLLRLSTASTFMWDRVACCGLRSPRSSLAARLPLTVLTQHAGRHEGRYRAAASSAETEMREAGATDRTSQRGRGACDR